MSEAPSRTYGNDPIAGVCPSCRTGPLFLTSNNHVVCTRITCENPLAVDTLLHDRIAMNLALSAISEADKRKEATP